MPPITVELSDEEIMLLVKNNNLQVFAVLFERHHLRLYNFFLRYGVQASDAADLTQNVFYRLLKYRSSFNNANGTFKAWMYQSARNLLLDFRKMENSSITRGMETENTGHDAYSTDEGYTEEQFDKLEEAMTKLNQSQRELILLSRFEKLKYQEIAGIVGLSVPAIKVQVHRAIKKLRTIYFGNKTD